MIRYTLQRLLATIPVVLIVALIVFSLLFLTPGDPAAVMAGDNATPEQVAAIRTALGLDQPFLPRLFSWFGAVLSGDLGRSIFTGLPVTELISQRLGPTFSLMVITLVFSVIVAVPLGVIAAYRAGSWVDNTIMAGSVLGFSVPVFVFGYLLAWLLASKAQLLPVQGYKPLSEGLWPWLRHLILPMLSVSGVYIALIARITRTTMLEVLNQDYIRTARAKGVSERTVVMRHALRNMLIPIVTLIATDVGTLLGGAVITERVFAISGMGSLFVASIERVDVNPVMGYFLVIAITAIVFNFLADLAYAVLDPRVRVVA